MRFLSALTLLTSGDLALAALDYTKWSPPGPGDVRGPCPALNSMANHGFIPRDGRNNTFPVLVDVMVEAFNMSPELSLIVSQLGAATRSPDATFFDLPDLNKHNAFEHDASLSREDFYFSGEERVGAFDQATFDRWFDHFKGMEYISIEAAAAARYAMVKYSRENTPGFTYDTKHQMASYAEVVKFHKTMVDETGQCKTSFVRTLFEEERLPFNEGWRPPKQQIHGFLVAQNVMQHVLATPEKTVWFGENKPDSNQTTWDIPQCPFQRRRRG